MMYHLQGMGFIGSAIAHALAARGIPFTWNDTASPITAWAACTGAIYPADDGRSGEGYQAWMTSPPAWALQYIEDADYWYCTKCPPHEMKVTPVEIIGDLKRHPMRSKHFNAQRFVTDTQHKFRFGRLYGNVLDSPIPNTLVTHGFNSRLERYVWGWTRVMELDTSALGPNRACIYLRRGRFVMAYAYPIPGTPYHYAGSTLLPQRVAKGRDGLEDYLRWTRNFTELSNGTVRLVSAHSSVIQGWRPSSGSVSAEPEKPLWLDVDGVLTVLPLWHSGVRWLPCVLRELGERLGVGALWPEAERTEPGIGEGVFRAPEGS